MPRKPENAPLKVRIEKGQLVLSIGIETLAFATMNGTSGYFDGLKITNPRGFARDVVAELEREQEDGTTPVHAMIDAAAEAAAEQGSVHVADASDDEE